MKPFVKNIESMIKISMDKVELKFVCDIVGHDEATIRQMYNDWLGRPSIYQTSNGNLIKPLVTPKLVVGKECTDGDKEADDIWWKHNSKTENLLEKLKRI